MVDDSDSDYVSESELDDIPLSFPVGGRFNSQPDAAPSFGLNSLDDASGDGNSDAPGISRNRVSPFPPMDRLPVNAQAGEEPLPSSRGNPPGAQAGFKLNLGVRQRQEPETSAPAFQQPGSMPILALGEKQAKHNEPPCTARGVKPPRLFLPNPAAATPVASPSRKIQSGSTTTISLLSKAFVHEAQGNQSSCVRSVLANRVSESLGVAPEEISFFEIKPISDEAEVSGAHVAVMVKDSGFNLAALEELLENNQKLMDMQQTNASTINTLLNDHKEASSTALNQTIRSTELEKDLDQLQQKYKRMEEDNEALRDQLQQCDVQRQQMFHTISTLRKEFELFRSANSLPSQHTTNLHLNDGQY